MSKITLTKGMSRGEIDNIAGSIINDAIDAVNATVTEEKGKLSKFNQAFAGTFVEAMNTAFATIYQELDVKYKEMGGELSKFLTKASIHYANIDSSIRASYSGEKH